MWNVWTFISWRIWVDDAKKLKKKFTNTEETDLTGIEYFYYYVKTLEWGTFSMAGLPPVKWVPSQVDRIIENNKRNYYNEKFDLSIKDWEITFSDRINVSRDNSLPVPKWFNSTDNKEHELVIEFNMKEWDTYNNVYLMLWCSNLLELFKRDYFLTRKAPEEIKGQVKGAFKEWDIISVKYSTIKKYEKNLNPDIKGVIDNKVQEFLKPVVVEEITSNDVWSLLD